MDGPEVKFRGLDRPYCAGLAAAIAVLFAGALHADVIVVAPAPGPGVDFTEVSAAVAAARDGDVLLVAAGFYGPTVVDGKGITILGPASNDANIRSLELRNVPRASSVRLANLGLRSWHPSGGGPNPQTKHALRIADCSGSVIAQQVKVEHDSGFLVEAAHVSDSAAVAFSRCTIRGRHGVNGNEDELPASPGGDALRVTDSHVLIFDTEVRGGSGGHGDGVPAKDGGVALIQSGGVVEGIGSQFIGGNGGSGFVGDLISGFFPANGSGAYAVKLSRYAVLRHQRATFRKGKTYGSFAAFDPIVSDETASHPELPGTPTLLSGAARMKEHTVVEFTVAAEPGSPVIAFLGAGHAIVTESTILGLLFVGPPAAAFALGTTDAGGVLRLSVVVPFLPAGVSDVPLTLQALLPATATAPEAFTNPLALAWLDSSY
jgi:hypothetical protein